MSFVAFVYEDRSLSRQMFMTAGTYVLAHNGSSVIIMLKGTQFRSVFLSEDIFKTGKVWSQNFVSYFTRLVWL